MENSTIEEIENPFTMTGLLTAIIDDLNNLRKKIEFLERDLLYQNYDNFIVEDEDYRNV